VVLVSSITCTGQAFNQTAKRSFSRSSVRPGYNMERVGEEWRVSGSVFNSGRDQKRLLTFERGADSLSIYVVEREREV